MDDAELFRIGDVAKMYRLSTGTLRHYEQAGLLKPEYVDPATGYRYYSVRQFELLNQIRYLRALDLPLDEIADYLRNRDADGIAEKLRRQKEIIAAKQQELEQIARKLEHRIRQIEDARASELETVRLARLPAQRIVWLRDSLKWNSYLWLERSIRRLEENQSTPLAFQGKIGVGITREHLLAAQVDRYDLVFLLLDEEDDYRGEVERQPEGWYLTVRFCGSHGEAPAYYAMLLEEVRARGLQITGFAQELALIDYSICTDPAQFVTEIRIPVVPPGPPR